MSGFGGPFYSMYGDFVARGRASSASGKAQEAQTNVHLLEAEVERLLILCEAMWSFIKEKHGVGEEDLLERIESVDLKDGRLDGRVAAEPPVECPHCGRTLQKKRTVCLYCGEAVPSDPFQR